MCFSLNDMCSLEHLSLSVKINLMFNREICWLRKPETMPSGVLETRDMSMVMVSKQYNTLQRQSAEEEPPQTREILQR